MISLKKVRKRKTAGKEAHTPGNMTPDRMLKPQPPYINILRKPQKKTALVGCLARIPTGFSENDPLGSKTTAQQDVMVTGSMEVKNDV